MVDGVGVVVAGVAAHLCSPIHWQEENVELGVNRHHAALHAAVARADGEGLAHRAAYRPTERHDRRAAFVLGAAAALPALEQYGAGTAVHLDGDVAATGNASHGVLADNQILVGQRLDYFEVAVALAGGRQRAIQARLDWLCSGGLVRLAGLRGTMAAVQQQGQRRDEQASLQYDSVFVHCYLPLQKVGTPRCTPSPQPSPRWGEGD